MIITTKIVRKIPKGSGGVGDRHGGWGGKSIKKQFQEEGKHTLSGQGPIFEGGGLGRVRNNRMENNENPGLSTGKK